jgi:hypothetical protein
MPVCLSVLQHGPRVDLGCRSNEHLDHTKARMPQNPKVVKECTPNNDFII